VLNLVDPHREFCIHSILTLSLNNKLKKSGEEHKWNMIKNRIPRRIFVILREREKKKNSMLEKIS
jgi:hypothetical protein